jgi:hypothetical protein
MLMVPNSFTAASFLLSPHSSPPGTSSHVCAHLTGPLFYTQSQKHYTESLGFRMTYFFRCFSHTEQYVYLRCFLHGVLKK